MKFFNLIPFGFILLVQSCTIYKRDILFKAPKEMNLEFAKNSELEKVRGNYLTSKNDLIEFQVFTNKGEALIDPTSELAKQGTGANSSQNTRVKYLIQSDGYATLPIIGRTKLDSLTTNQCDSLLGKLYSKFYLDCYVISRVSNRRIFILGKGSSVGGGGGSGGGGGGASIMELENENTSLMEVLAKVGGPGIYSHVERIKIIRGDLKNPKILSVDLTHWNSFQKSELTVLPNDIIYLEPGRRKTFDFLRDISAISGLASAALTFYLLLRIQ